jgi:hypothetical protein
MNKVMVTMTFLAFATFVLAGCSTQKFIDLENAHLSACKPGTGCTPKTDISDAALLSHEKKIEPTQKEIDLSVCNNEAARVACNSQTGHTLYGARFNVVTNTFKRSELSTLCMKHKGHTGVEEWGKPPSTIKGKYSD